MKTKLFYISVITLLSFPTLNFAQAPVLGTAADFVLFSSVGAVTNTGVSHITGNVGTNSGSSTGFGNVNGQMHDNDGVSAQCSTDLLIAYNQLNATTPTQLHAPALGNGEVLVAGVYDVPAASSLSLDLFLDAQNNPNAVFIFLVNGPLSTGANSKVNLMNGALACNIYWKVEGLVSMSPGTTMRGTVIANNAAISMTAGDTLIGRALSTNGAVTMTNLRGGTPVAGCEAPLTGPTAPVLGTAACFAIFSSNGTVSNSGTTFVTGDIGTNSGAVTGYNASNVTGTIHPNPDAATAQCAADVAVAYNYLNALQYDIELLYPAQFGNDLVLTPHTYLLNAATVFSDTLYLNAQGNASAVFVIKVNGAFSSALNAKVILTNGAQSKNVYWQVEGAVLLDDSTAFAGTLICNNGALGAINTGVYFDGRALTTTGALTTTAVTVVATAIPGNCSTATGINSTAETSEAVTIYPNPFSTTTTIKLNDASQINSYEISIFNVLGEAVIRTSLTSSATTISTSTLTTGMYFYKIIDKTGNTIQSGRMISQQ